MHEKQYQARVKALNADVEVVCQDFQNGKVSQSRFDHVMGRAQTEYEKLTDAYNE